ncbi:MAG: tetratricopeptide repeat protein [Parvularculaceae bacterium]
MNVFFRLAGFAFVALCAAAATASAQLSVTTIGATDARICYENARSATASDTTPCDEALGDPALTQIDRRKTLVNRGIIHNRNGDLQAAVDDFNAALASDPSLPEAYINRGNSFFLGGQFDRAIADYEEALSQGLAKQQVGWYNIGLAYDAKKEPERARAAYEKALELDPEFALAREKLEERAR